MGRTVNAEERLLDYLKSFTGVPGYTVGLILGQRTEEKDYVVHLARSPPPASRDVIEESLIIGGKSQNKPELESTCIKTLEDIPKNWIADHSKHVTKMLPGGMRVLGIFIVGPTDALRDENSTDLVRRIVADIEKKPPGEERIANDSGINQSESLVISLNSLSLKVVCKYLDAKRGGPGRLTKCKFESEGNKWHCLETHIDFDEKFAISRELESKRKTLKQQLQDILASTALLVNSALAVIEGEVQSPEETIEILVKNIETAEEEEKGERRKGEQQQQRLKERGSGSGYDERMLQVILYIPRMESLNPMEISKIDCSASIRLIGQLVSRTFVHESANVREACDAVKEDVMRSLAARFEMHWDSLIEEEEGSPEENITLHELPRRVLVQLPQSKITFSDYLFPGEGAQEALISLHQLLDLRVQESSVQKEIELQLDPSEFYCQNDKKIEQKLDYQTSRGKNTNIILYGIGLALLYILILISLIKQYNA